MYVFVPVEIRLSYIVLNEINGTHMTHHNSKQIARNA